MNTEDSRPQETFIAEELRPDVSRRQSVEPVDIEMQIEETGKEASEPEPGTGKESSEPEPGTGKESSEPGPDPQTGKEVSEPEPGTGKESSEVDPKEPFDPTTVEEEAVAAEIQRPIM